MQLCAYEGDRPYLLWLKKSLVQSSCAREANKLILWLNDRDFIKIAYNSLIQSSHAYKVDKVCLI